MKTLAERMRKRLVREKVILREELRQLREEARAEDLEMGGDNTPMSEPMDQAQAGIDKEVRAEQVGRLLVRLARLDDALARLSRGEYGVCCTCGRTIPRKRLEAMPEALQCVSCKQEAETVENHPARLREGADLAEPGVEGENNI